MYRVEFPNDGSIGFYKRTEMADYDPKSSTLPPPSDNVIYITDPDIELISLLVNKSMKPDYVNITLDDIKQEKYSIDAVKIAKHLILIGECWAIYALLKKVHETCFEFSFGGVHKVFVSRFGLGEPMTD